jgi:hypothetical protein
MSGKLQKWWPVLALSATVAIVGGITVSGMKTVVLAKFERQP